MIAYLVLLLLGQTGALPPHPLDDVIGDKKIEPREVVARISDSPEWRAIARKAIDKAKEPAEKIGPTYPQRIRSAIARDLRNEKEEEGKAAAKGAVKALPEHPLDDVIGEVQRPRRLIRILRDSKEFAKIVEKAVKESTELRKDEAGATFGQQVRMKIAAGLLPGVDEDDAKGAKKE